MGEISEMMLDGTLCQVCGEFMDGEAAGFPITCAGCGGNEWETDELEGSFKEVPTQKRGEKQIDYILRLRDSGFVNKQIAGILGVGYSGLRTKLRAHYARIKQTTEDEHLNETGTAENNDVPREDPRDG